MDAAPGAVAPPGLDACPRCGGQLPAGARYCPNCGNSILSGVPALPTTHGVGFVVIAVLLSLLWFRVNNVPVLPLGLIGGILLAYWSHDIDTRLGKPSLLAPAVVLCLIATAVGLIIH